MKLNKKFMSLFTAMLVAAGILTACGGADDNGNNNEEPTVQEEDTEEDEEEVEADGTSAASVSDVPEHMVEMLTNGGSWMFAATTDMELADELVIQGDLHHRNDPANDLRRKLGLYESDRSTGETVIVNQFTLTVPAIIIDSENTLIQLGTVDGDIYVNAPGFHLSGTTVTGNVIFASQELYDSADFESAIEGYETVVEGEIKVAE